MCIFSHLFHSVEYRNVKTIIFGSDCHLSSALCKVSAYWQWHRYNESRVPAGKRLLLINLDETSVSFAPEQKAGLIVIRSAQHARAKIKKQDLRTNLTYVATICDDKSLQKCMPHFIIGDNARISQEQLAALRRSTCDSVHVLRNEKSAWNNHVLMNKILKTLSDSLAHRPDLQPELIMDVAPCHIHASVFHTASKLGIWLVFVPASITCLAQPLDTHAFFAFKAWLRCKYAELRGKATDGLVTRIEWLRVLQAAKAEFFDGRSWVRSFTTTGARLPCAQLTKALSKYASPSDIKDGEAAEPGMQELSLVWPRNRRMNFASSALFPKQDDQPAQCPRQAAAVKRPLPAEPAMSIALASRSLKRACRQYPSRSTE